MNHDGSGYGEYEDPRYIDYQDLLWSGDGTRLLFNAIHDDLKFDVLLLDVTTGAVHVVGERLAARLNTRADDPVAAFTFAWLSEHGRWGYGGFAEAGAPVFHVDTGVHWIGRSRAFWSPDLRHVAVKMGTGWGEWLVVAERDTRRYDIVSYGLSGLGDPVWQGADELYFTQSINWGPVQDVTHRVE
jgi:hypothetical protein